MIVMTSSFTRAALAMLAGVAITSAAATRATANPPKTKTYPSAITTTYRQRVHASPSNRPIKSGALILPQTAAKKVKPFLARGGRLQYRNPDLARVAWQILPKSDKHREYLKKRRALPAKDRGQLVTWCKQNGLEILVEYELRCQLAAMRKPNKPGYKSILNQWMPYAQKRQSNYVFALPVKGTWYVMVDRNRHHRDNAFTAFAFDLIIRKNGKPCGDNPRLNSSYYAWSQPIYAQADGIVETVYDNFDDMPAGKYGRYGESNDIVIDYGAGLMASYSHLQKGSIRVKVGDHVKGGQEIARVGNSGFSGHPHLHFNIMDASGFSLKGRYQFQQRTGGGQWLQIEQSDLTEGSEIRPAPGTLKKATTKPKPTDRSPEKLAASKLRLARAYLSYPKESKAKALLQSIVKDYPTTPAAAEAKKELAKLK